MLRCRNEVFVFFLWQQIWVFPKIGVPQHGWFIMENPTKMADLGGKPTIFGNIHIISLIFLAPKKRNTVLSHCSPNRGAPLCHTHLGDDAKDMA